MSNSDTRSNRACQSHCSPLSHSPPARTMHTAAMQRLSHHTAPSSHMYNCPAHESTHASCLISELYITAVLRLTPCSSKPCTTAHSPSLGMHKSTSLCCHAPRSLNSATHIPTVMHWAQCTMQQQARGSSECEAAASVRDQPACGDSNQGKRVAAHTCEWQHQV